VHLIHRVKELSRGVGTEPLVEFSGSKGYHFGYFFDPRVDCAPVRAALDRLTRT
jgi:hypothetical protein